MTQRPVLLLLSGALLLLPAAALGQAQHSPFGWYVEANYGSWSPGPDIVDADTSLVLRLGWKSPQTRWGIDLQYGFNEATIPGLEIDDTPIDVDIELKPLDLSLSYFPIMNKRFQLMFIFGPGWTFGEAKASVPIDEENNISQLVGRLNSDTFTVNAGIGARIFFTDTVYLRLDGRGRWNEKREDDEIDYEYTAGIGFNF